MSWVYNARNKYFSRNGVFQFSSKYAGAPGFKDNPDFECLVNKGPIPRGKYRIVEIPFTHKIAASYTLRLKPYATNSMCGRDGFLIHGDSRNRPGSASTGCIVLDPDFRRDLWESGDKEIIVE